MADTRRIINLPNCILANIFERVSRKDLIQLTTVCKKFNEIISSSPKILYKLPVDFEKGNKEKEWIDGRKYSNIIVSDARFEQRLPIIESLADNILRFKFCMGSENKQGQQNVDIDDLIDLLQKMKNLRHLSFLLPENYEIKPSKNNTKLALTLKTLDGFICPKMFPFLFDCSVQHFTGYTYKSSEFIEFLKQQKDLQYLDADMSDSELFKDESLMNVDFKLKKFKLHYGCADKVENVVKFLLQFKESLEWLDMRDCDERILKILPEFVNLNTLKLYQSNVSQAMPSIEHLMIVEWVRPNFPNMFPNVKQLTIQNPIDVDALEHFPKLESITTVDNVEDHIPQSPAKRLTIIHHESNMKPFDYQEHNFEEIYVVKRDENKQRWLKEFIDGGHAAKLKIFSKTIDKYIAFHNI